MDLPMYEDMRKLITTPYTHYVTQLQALVNNRWENSTQTNFNVWQEAPFGSKEFVPVEVSIDTSIDIGTGFKKGDDFKIFSHRDISHQVPLGTMFKTDTDYWICINTNGYASPTNSCEVRRCNNIMRWINPENGYVYQQWCVIDYELSAPQPLKDKQIVTANGHIFLIVQGNELTRSLRKNQNSLISTMSRYARGERLLPMLAATILTRKFRFKIYMFLKSIVKKGWGMFYCQKSLNMQQRKKVLNTAQL